MPPPGGDFTVINTSVFQSLFLNFGIICDYLIIQTIKCNGCHGRTGHWENQIISAEPHFQSTTSETSTELIIVTLSDSALYYYALRAAAQ